VVNATRYKTTLHADLTQKAPDIYSPYSENLVIPPPSPFPSRATVTTAPASYTDVPVYGNSLRSLAGIAPSMCTPPIDPQNKNNQKSLEELMGISSPSIPFIDPQINVLKTIHEILFFDIGKWIDNTIYSYIEQPILDFTAKPRHFIGDEAKKADDLAMKATDLLGIKTKYIITKTGVKWAFDFVASLYGIVRHPTQTAEGLIGFAKTVVTVSDCISPLSACDDRTLVILKNISDTASDWIQKKVDESVKSSDKATENITYGGLEIVSLVFGGSIGKAGKIEDLVEFTKIVNKIDNLEDIAKAAKYLNTVEDIASLTKTLKGINDLKKAAILLDQIEDITKITKIVARYGDYIETAALLEKMQDAKKVAALMNAMEDTKRASLIFKEMKDVDKAVQVLKQVGLDKAKALLEGYNDLEKSAQIINRLDQPLKVKADLFKSANIDELIKYQQKFEKLYPAYKDSMQFISKDIGIQVDVANVKDIDRMAEKAIDKYGGDIKQVNDMLRSTFVIDSLDDIPKVKKAIESKYGQYGDITFKDYIRNPSPETHYPNFHMNAPLNTGEIVEIKIVPREVYEVGKVTHDLYEIERVKSASDFSKIQEINDAAGRRFLNRQK